MLGVCMASIVILRANAQMCFKQLQLNVDLKAFSLSTRILNVLNINLEITFNVLFSLNVKIRVILSERPSQYVYSLEAGDL